MTKIKTDAVPQQAGPQEIADDALDIGGAGMGLGSDLNLGCYTGSAEVEVATGRVHHPVEAGWDLLKQPAP